MAEINDFGFTAVDQDELKTKTGEDASISKEVADQLKAVAASSAGQANSAQIEELDSKVDLLTKLISNSLSELDDHKDNLSAIDTKKELDYKDRLLECESTISSSLHGIILSVAYGIPTRWVKMGNRLAGTGLKFYDFYLSLTRKEIGGEELNKYVELVTKYINKNITKEEVVNEAEDIGYMFPVNISEIEIKDIFSLPIIIKYNNDMVDKLLEVFPSDKIKL